MIHQNNKLIHPVDLSVLCQPSIFSLYFHWEQTTTLFLSDKWGFLFPNSIHPFQVLEELGMKTSLDRGLVLIRQLAKAVLHSLKAGHSSILTPSDVQYLTQMIDVYLSATVENVMPFAADYVIMASLMLEPQMAAQWIGRAEDGVRVTRIIRFSAQMLFFLFLNCQKPTWDFFHKDLNCKLLWMV